MTSRDFEFSLPRIVRVEIFKNYKYEDVKCLFLYSEVGDSLWMCIKGFNRYHYPEVLLYFKDLL